MVAKAAPFIPRRFINIILKIMLDPNKRSKDFVCSSGLLICKRICSNAKQYESTAKPITIIIKLKKPFELKFSKNTK
tara:strand:+ start:2304 stop:2534 length:231 start_codon:yes stop_codon:yes gene_type:complete